MKCIVDTHALIWWLNRTSADSRLSPQVIALMEDPNNDIMVSAVSAWEIATKCANGKGPELEVLARNFEQIVHREGFDTLHITASHARVAAFLPKHHKDPWDRMLIDRAISMNIPLISRDSNFDRYDDLAVIW